MREMNEFDPYLTSLGWNEFFKESFNEDKGEKFIPGRVIGQSRGHYHIQVGPKEILEAPITSKLRHSAQTAIDFPAVGDWVTFVRGQENGRASIHRILKRRNSIQRKRAGTQNDIQLIATNIDFMFIVSSLNEDFDLKRIGRFVALGRDSGLTTVLLLTKSDLCTNPESYIDQLKGELENVERILISNKDAQSIEQLQKFFEPGKTSVLVGASGVGKSTLTNYLLGFDSQKTQSLSAESKGRHTTTSRNLLVTRWGGLVIDTPGIQDVSGLDQNLQKNFSDIEDLVLKCKFTNCRHHAEPGCAISRALKSGQLHQDRWKEYLKAHLVSSRT